MSIAPIEGAPEALPGKAMSGSGTPESGLAREVASGKRKFLDFKGNLIESILIYTTIGICTF